jgi:hypothetical protein
MVEMDFGGAMVDVCKNGCKGIWFDPMEMRRVRTDEMATAAALAEALDHPRTSDKGRERINCPRCSIPMHRHKFKSAREVDVDECYVCGGLFLDSGELKAIETGSLSEEEAQDYYEKLVSELPVYKEAERELMQKKLDAEAGQVRADAMRFLTGIYNFNR